MSQLEQLQALLEDFHAAGEEIWLEADARAANLVAERTSRGEQDLRESEGHRSFLARSFVLNQTLGFLRDAGIDEGEIERVMTANGNGFTEADIMNLNDGILPSREAIEAFRVRALCFHFAVACDVAESQRLVEGS